MRIPWWPKFPFVPETSVSPVLVAAYPVSTSCVHVDLNTAPQYLYATAPGDAQNRSVWVITRLDTGFVYPVLLINSVGPTALEIFVLGSWGGAGVQHQISAPNLKSVSGAVYTGTPTFKGVYVPQDLTKQRPQMVDLLNLATPRNPIGGTLQINSGGDYKTGGGANFLRNMIVRRWLTPKGAFFHLPNYGFGLRPKMTFTAPALRDLKTDLIAQCFMEPEVVAANVNIEYADGVLEIDASVQSKDGSVVDFPKFTV